MVSEKKWFETRKEIIEKNNKRKKIIDLGILWFCSLFFILILMSYWEMKLPSIVYAENNFTIIILVIVAFGPFILLNQIFSYKDISDEELIAYHLYNISLKLESLNEFPQHVKLDIYKSLRALDTIIQRNQENAIFFSENINATFRSLIDSLERINTYINSSQNNTSFNQLLSYNLKYIVNSIRNEKGRITDELSNTIRQLTDSFKDTERTKIILPPHKKVCDEFKNFIIKMPSLVKLALTIIIIALLVWYIPAEVGIIIEDYPKIMLVAIVSIPFIERYLKEQRWFSST